MPFRDWILRVLAISPFFVVGVVSAKTRFFSDPFQPYSYSDAQESAVNAYIEPVREAVAADIQHASAAKTRQVAKIWLAGAEAGSLKALPSNGLDDLAHSQVKTQIYLTEDSIVRRLMVVSKQEEAEGHYGDEAKDLILGLQLCEILKYSDPFAVDVLSGRQKTILNYLEDAIPHLSDGQRQWVCNELTAVRAHQQPLDSLFDSFKDDWQRERFREETNLRASYDPEHAMETSLVPDGTSFSQVVKDSQHNVQLLGPDYLREFNLAYKSENRFMQKLDNFTTRLSHGGHPVAD